MNILYKDYQDLNQEQIHLIVEQDCTIPLAYDPHFVVNEKMFGERIKYYEELIQKGFFKIAFDDGKIIGFHAIMLEKQKELMIAHIGTFWIHSDYQRQGIGRKLKEMGEKWAREQSCTYLKTGVHYANKRMLEINTKAGFDIYSVTMLKKLGSKTN